MDLLYLLYTHCQRAFLQRQKIFFKAFFLRLYKGLLVLYSVPQKHYSYLFGLKYFT